MSRSLLMFVCAGLAAMTAVLLYLWGAWQSIIQRNGPWTEAAAILLIYAAGFVVVGFVFAVAGTPRPAAAGTASGFPFLKIAAVAAPIAAVIYLVELWRLMSGLSPDSEHWADGSGRVALIAFACALLGIFFPQR